MPISTGESNKLFRVATNFDMSSSTALQLDFTDPNGTTSTLTNATTPAVTAPAVAVTDPDLGALAASEYMEFATITTTFTVSGTWKVCPTYTNTGTTPDTIYEGSVVTFTVLDGC